MKEKDYYASQELQIGHYNQSTEEYDEQKEMSRKKETLAWSSR